MAVKGRLIPVPNLDDRDWQYEDGVLAGIQSVRVALRALRNRRS